MKVLNNISNCQWFWQYQSQKLIIFNTEFTEFWHFCELFLSSN